MPTETEVNGKLYMKDAAGNVTEVGSVNSIELAGEECQEAELKEIEGGYSGEILITFKKDDYRRLMKKMGLETITRKRFKKLLMGCGMQRNDTEIVAQAFNENGIRYTPLAIQKVIETINEEAEKEEKKNETI
jgi:hypothetical protein